MGSHAVALVPAPLTLVPRGEGHADDTPALRVLGGDGHALGARGVDGLRRIDEGDLEGRKEGRRERDARVFDAVIDRIAWWVA